jgi:serine/threonine protein phosphatase PrpC
LHFEPNSDSLKSTFAEHGISFASKKGSKSGPNQDDFLCLRIEVPAQIRPDILLGVFDGHGDNGHIVSNLVQRLFPKVLP